MKESNKKLLQGIAPEVLASTFRERLDRSIATFTDDGAASPDELRKCFGDGNHLAKATAFLAALEKAQRGDDLEVGDIRNIRNARQLFTEELAYMRKTDGQAVGIARSPAAARFLPGLDHEGPLDSTTASFEEETTQLLNRLEQAVGKGINRRRM